MLLFPCQTMLDGSCSLPYEDEQCWQMAGMLRGNLQAAQTVKAMLL